MLKPSDKQATMRHRINETKSRSTSQQVTIDSLQREEEDLIEDLLGSAADFLDNVFPHFASGIYLSNLSGTELVLRRETGKNYSFREALDPDDETVQQILSSVGTSLLLPGDKDNLYEMLIDSNDSDQIKGAVLSVPIRFDGLIKGLLAIHTERFDKLEERDKILLDNHAVQIGNHLGLLTGRAQLHAIKKFEQNFHKLVSELDLTRSREEMLSSLVQFCEAEFSFDKLTIALIDNDSLEKAVMAESSGFTMDYGAGDEVEYAGSHLEKVLSDHKTLIINSLDEASSTGRFSVGDIEEYNFQSFLATPVTNKHGVQGALVLESFTSSHFSETDSELLEIVAFELGTLLDWWDTFGNIRETASKDGLTGLFNHRVFIERFEDELQRAKRYEDSLVLMILDLDKFKRINDTYGHLYGDYILKATAQLLKESVRGIDIVARYGGEEFAIILINAQKEDTFTTMKRMVENIANYEFEEGGIIEHMTISAGAAEFPFDGENRRALISVADEAMYQVKRKGGNAVGLPDKTTT